MSVSRRAGSSGSDVGASIRSSPHSINQLQVGSTYPATTLAGTTVGGYLSMETPFGERSILLRHAGGTNSISVVDLTAVDIAA